MKINVWVGFALLILLLIVLSYIQFRQKQHQEYFGQGAFTPSGQGASVEYYVIHDRTNQERTKNIETQEAKLGKPIVIFDAIMGKDLDLNNLSVFDPNLHIIKPNRNNVIGCYLSHFMLIKSLLPENSGRYESSGEFLRQNTDDDVGIGRILNKTQGYTMIFENDFEIVTDDLDHQIQHILQIIDKDFDLLYLGNLSEVHSHLYKENIYDIQESVTGTHAYLVNHRNIQKIYNVLLSMDEAIDWKFSNSIQKKELQGLVIYPTLVNQNGMNSTIGNT
uniref:Glycosyl transferase family 25 domain-containing protein n=1 Tax=viral metagenome TaxID=1070528 RepID=A0A6C0HTN8_9ZZZZ